MSSGFVPTEESTLFMCILYISLGGLSVCCNLLNIFIFCDTKEFRKRYIYFTTLNIGELVNAISYILVGTGRATALLQGKITQPTTVYECFFNRYWPHSLILGTQIPSLCIILISMERLCAVHKPHLYSKIFGGPYKIHLLSMVPLLALISLAVGGSSAFRERDRIVSTQHCAIISSTSKIYSTFHFVFIVVAYFLSFLTLAVVYYLTTRICSMRYGGEQSNVRLILTIAFSSLILISMPSFVMISINWDWMQFSDFTVSITYAMPGFISIVNTIINYSCRKELRQQLLFVLRLRDSHVSPVQSHQFSSLHPAQKTHTNHVTHHH